jgi:hypothetical protein
MSTESIRELLHENPFRPFWIHSADASKIEVVHTDFVALQPTGHEVTVYLPNGRRQILDPKLITRLEPKSEKKSLS